jgi:RND family efflux transporter MFP subunit
MPDTSAVPPPHQIEGGPEPKLLDDPRHPVFAPHHVARGKVILLVSGIVILLVVLFLVGYLPRVHRDQALAEGSREEAGDIPVVSVARARRAPSRADLLLPGNITPLTEASIYARAAGYLKRRYVDIGDRVKAGQLLAEIDAPDLDSQVHQGRAIVSQAQSNLAQMQAAQVQRESRQKLAKVQFDRWTVLVNKGVLAKQELDQKQADFESAAADVDAAKANVQAAQQAVHSAQANLQRLIDLQAYKQVRAPFTGVITARNVDVGALISAAGASQGTSTTPGAANGGEMFREAQIGRLRIMVNVPQTDAAGIALGQPAEVDVEQLAGPPFQGAVTRTSQSLDPGTRTLLTEVQVTNPQQVLLPGMYAQVKFEVHRSQPPLLVPGDSLVTRASGTSIATLDAQNRVHFMTVSVGRDFGTEIEIRSGLPDGAVVVVNPSDDVREGAVLKPNFGNGAVHPGAASGASGPRALPSKP